MKGRRRRALHGDSEEETELAVVLSCWLNYFFSLCLFSHLCGLLFPRALSRAQRACDNLSHTRKPSPARWVSRPGTQKETTYHDILYTLYKRRKKQTQ